MWSLDCAEPLSLYEKAGAPGNPGFLERVTIEDEDDDENEDDCLGPCDCYNRCPDETALNVLGDSCQGGELNSRPRAYESPALPLSYPGKISITEEAKSKTVEPGFKSLCWPTIGTPKMFAHL